MIICRERVIPDGKVIVASSDLCPPSVKPGGGGFDGVGDRGHSRAVEFPALPEQRDVEMVIGDLGQCRINELVRECDALNAIVAVLGRPIAREMPLWPSARTTSPPVGEPDTPARVCAPSSPLP